MFFTTTLLTQLYVYKIKDVFFTTTLLTQLYVKFGILLTCGKYFSPPVYLVGSVLLIFLVFFCCPIMCLYVLSSVLSCRLRFPHTNDVRFVVTCNCLKEGSCHSYAICICLRIVVSNTYCVVFLLCLSSSFRFLCT